MAVYLFYGSLPPRLTTNLLKLSNKRNAKKLSKVEPSIRLSKVGLYINPLSSCVFSTMFFNIDTGTNVKLRGKSPNLRELLSMSLSNNRV